MKFKCVNLNTILRDIYDERNKGLNIRKDIYESNYENFKKDNIKKLKKISYAMGIDISNYKINKNYEIPEIVGDVFKVYLTENSGKNTFISKIINKKFEDISYEEKKKFIRKVTKKLQETGKYDEKNLIEFESCKIIEIENSVILKNSIDNIIKNSSNLIEERCRKFLEFNEKNGLLIVNDKIHEIFSYDFNKEIVDMKNSDNMLYIDILNYDEKQILLNHLYKMIEDTINNWERLIRIANEEKHIEQDNEIDEEFFYNKEYKPKFQTPRELLDIAIEIYNDELIRGFQKKNEISDDFDMKLIMEELKRELEEKNKN